MTTCVYFFRVSAVALTDNAVAVQRNRAREGEFVFAAAISVWHIVTVPAVLPSAAAVCRTCVAL